MHAGSEQTKELYIPDFKLWRDYYAKTVKSQNGADQTQQHESFSQPKEASSEVKLQFVSPVTETTNQAASIMKADNLKTKRKTTKTKKTKALHSKQGSNKIQKRKTKASFSYRKLNDIFSKKNK